MNAIYLMYGLVPSDDSRRAGESALRTGRERKTGYMSAVRAFLYAPAGRRTKWLVVLFWLILVVVAGPLSGKLTGAEKNDSSSWLPPAAESTQVLNLRSSAISPNVYPGVLVYDRPSGITAADKAKAAADAAKLAKIDGAVPGTVIGPITARDNRAVETIVQVNLGSKGWSAAGPHRR
jgi:RND superfamily putative drug exporter